jgi:hypothetical protein
MGFSIIASSNRIKHNRNSCRNMGDRRKEEVGIRFCLNNSRREGYLKRVKNIKKNRREELKKDIRNRRRENREWSR